MINKVLLMEFFKDDDIKVVDKDFYIKSQMKSDVIKYITILEEENERLNNIINELEDMIVIKLQRDYHEHNYRINTGDLEEIYDKLKELKGSDKD